MGLHADELIDHMCEACHNICFCSNSIPQWVENTRMRNLLKPIQEYIRELAEPELSMKRRRKILSKPQVGKGIYTALASFVMPALLSMI